MLRVLTPRHLCRYIMLDLRSSSFQNLTTMPGCISSKVPSNISIYGISLIVKRELGPCALNVRIYHQKEEGTPEEMEPSWKLAEIGFVGTMPPEEPQPLMLLYDYDYPFLDCPILMANFSTWRGRIISLRHRHGEHQFSYFAKLLWHPCQLLYQKRNHSPAPISRAFSISDARYSDVPTTK